MKILETERLVLRQLSADDAELILELLNEPAFLRNIGDKGVRTIDDARRYILDGPVANYERLGFGLYKVELKGEGENVPIGTCGLVKRDGLEDVDIGFAFLSRFWGKGYAFESASAVMTYGKETLGIERIVAVVAPHNEASINVLRKLGLELKGSVKLPGYENEDSLLFTPAV